jgi:hypothetical protein
VCLGLLQCFLYAAMWSGNARICLNRESHFYVSFFSFSFSLTSYDFYFFIHPFSLISYEFHFFTFHFFSFSFRFECLSKSYILVFCFIIFSFSLMSYEFYFFSLPFSLMSYEFHFFSICVLVSLSGSNIFLNRTF